MNNLWPQTTTMRNSSWSKGLIFDIQFESTETGSLEVNPDLSVVQREGSVEVKYIARSLE